MIAFIVHSLKSKIMAITRTETQNYFKYFDILVDTDGKRLNCFKCGFDLKYISTTIGYRCINSHAFTFVNMVNTHAGFMASLVTSLSDNKVCDS